MRTRNSDHWAGVKISIGPVGFFESQAIELHSLWGWMHVSQGLFLCRYPDPGSPPLSRPF